MGEKAYSEITACRICGDDGLKDILDLGEQALSGRFPGPDEADPPIAPLVLVQCSNCGLVQLRHTADFGEMYTTNYGYQSGTNATMRAHLAGIVAWISERCPLNAGDTVIDIGCNDGTLLLSHSNDGLERVGIDPLAAKFKDKFPPDIQLIEDFFSADLAAKSFGADKVKAISSIAMFYDLEDPPDFVAGIARLLADDGIWVLEMSYLPTMLETNAFDTVCHEHLEYYALEQIERLAQGAGLRVFDAEMNDINGGSIRLAVCHDKAPYEASRSYEEIRAQESGLGLRTPGPYQAFRERITAIRDELKAFIEREHAAGKKIYLYGASTKGNVLLQFCGLDHRHIAAAADLNPEKWGHRTPLTHIPIVSEETARADEPDYFLVLPWHFRAEFLEREAAFRERGGKLVFPLPEVEVV